MYFTIKKKENKFIINTVQSFKVLVLYTKNTNKQMYLRTAVNFIAQHKQFFMHCIHFLYSFHKEQK